MKKFIVTYHAPNSAMEQMQNTPPEEAKKGMEMWMEWANKCGTHLVDMGTPLTPGQRILPNNKSDNSKRQVCGYSILQADNMDQAKKLMEGHPHLSWNGECEIEVHESLPIPGE